MIIYYLTIAAAEAGSIEFDKYAVGARHQALSEWENIKKHGALHKTEVAAAYVEQEGSLFQRWNRDGYAEIWNRVDAAGAQPIEVEPAANPSFTVESSGPVTVAGTLIADEIIVTPPVPVEDDNGVTGAQVAGEEDDNDGA